MADRETLSTGRLIALSLPSAAFAGYELARRSFLAPFLTADASLDMAVVGGLVTLAAFASIPAELVVGALSDHGGGRVGRRRFWMILGTGLILLGALALLAPGNGPSPVVFALGLIGLGVGWATCNVNHGAWALEIAEQSPSRGRIFGLRTVFGIAGAIGYSALATLAASVRASPFALIMAGSALAALLLHGALIALVPDVSAPEDPWDGRRALEPLRLLVANPANLRLAALFALNGAHTAITGTGYFYAVENGLGLKGWAPTGVLIQMVCAAVGVLAVLRFGGRWRARALLRAVLWGNLVLAIAFPFLPRGQAMFAMAWSVLFGLISSIDFVALRMLLGERLDASGGSARGGKRAAAHYAGFHLPFNLCGAMASGLLFVGYHALGFDPRLGASAEQLFLAALLAPSLAAAGIMSLSLLLAKN